MEYRDIGTSDLKVSVVGLGCNNFGARMDLATARTLVHHAIDRGINHFDTADIYGPRGKSEEMLGEILGSKRKDVVVATKFGMVFDEAGTMKGASRKYIMTAVEGSLRRLRTDYIDLYYQHRADPSVPIEETLRALDDLVKQGKVRHIGNSNFDGRQLDEADATARKLGLTRFICAQDELSLIKRHVENDRIPAMVRNKIALVPYFPLASGLLTGKYRRGAPAPAGTRLAAKNRLSDLFWTQENLELTYRIVEFCEQHKLNVLDVAFAWLLEKPFVPSVIAGASRPDQIDANIKAAAARLSGAELGALDRLTEKALETQPH
ncbi:MAG TPA: aldo/keto reductase [Xanthobacteraceae bacterium]|nr:aldo/keto reductase [Xanthobacteraceae bacterium]